MHSFTENILARARERQKMLEGYSNTEKTPLRESNTCIESQTIHKEYLSDPVVHKKEETSSLMAKENKSDSNLPSFSRQNSRTRISSEVFGSPKSQSKTFNIQQENFNMEIKLTSTDNVRVQVEIEEGEDNYDDSDTGNEQNECVLREASRNKLKKLGKLYAGGDDVDISSPIHRTEGKFHLNDKCEENKPPPPVSQTTRGVGLSKLAQLAETINQWEDDNVKPNTKSHKSSPKKSSKAPAPQPPLDVPTKQSPVKLLQKPRAPEAPLIKKVNFEEGMENIDRKGRGNVAKITENGPKKLTWDQKVLDNLESANRVEVAKTTAMETTEVGRIKQLANKLEERVASEDGDSRQDSIKPAQKTANNRITEEKMAPQSNTRVGTVANRAAMFQQGPSTKTNTKDPALLTVSERKALFEKNKGEALMPKAAFAMAVPCPVETTMKASSTKIMTNKNVEVHKPLIHSPPKSQQKSCPESPKRHQKLKHNPQPIPQNSKPESPKIQRVGATPQGRGIVSTMAALLQNQTTISQEQIENSIKSQKEKDIEMLLNRFNKNKGVSNQETIQQDVEDSDEDDEIDATEETAMVPNRTAQIVNANRRSAEKRKSGEKPYCKEDSPVVAAVLDDVKRIKVTEPKAGRLYPCLSDIETATETETDTHTRTPTPEGNSSFEENNYDSDNPNTSFGRDILEAVCKNQTPQKRPILDESTESDLSSILDDNDYLEDIPADICQNIGPTRPKQIKQITPQKTMAQPSNSFNYKNFNTPTKKNTPQKIVELPEYVLEGDNALPLTHTVSFYRKQQSQVQTPVRQIIRQPIIEESPEKCADDTEAVQTKIRSLEEEVNKQQNIIAQTSQALNLCMSTPEFSGSTEQVEAEKVLLVATHRRQAALLELQRLRVEGTIRPQGQSTQNMPLEKGTLTISKIVLPLKHKYVKALAAAGGKGHHIVCLIKCGEQVIPAKLVSTIVCNSKNPDTEVIVPGTITLNGICSDSTVTFEVYCLQAQEEFLPHEVKYHINNKKSSNKLTTPKKSKHDSRMVMPIRESPGGPQAVRSPSFALNGYIVFSVQAINKKVWTLNNTPTMSPLDGAVEMKIHSELAVSVEHRGFLTMFEDISGLGAWHRRWCRLVGHSLSYWKYPDDEKKIPPIDTIDLKNCITKQVGPVSRDVCARLHTFLLERERPAHPKDKESLVTICRRDKTIIRHLLSADTKEERIEWCTKLNAALTSLRMWGNSQ